MSNAGPPSTVRLVLFAISTHMDMDGNNAFPSQKTLAIECDRSERCVRKALKEAEKLGWITRKRWRPVGKQWAQTRYLPSFPKSYPQQPEPRSGSTIPLPESHVEQPESDDHNYRNHVPTNSSVNSSKNSVFKKNPKSNFSQPPEFWKTFFEDFTSKH